ncbi:MAG: DNA polymerase III subunit [Verrucomicrobia bacterium]|nr:DNA polymerase III subunit [Verrucomicrobiota bacterium]
MAFADFPEQKQVVELLQRSLERQRLGHAYLFSGATLDELEAIARTLAKTLNCAQPLRRDGVAVDCCDRCLSCRKIDGAIHPDVMWVRPESKLRQIRIGQITPGSETKSRTINEFNSLKATEANCKVCVLTAVDRMNTNAANAFLKTLEEPSPRTVLILLTTERERVLETILSRCLRLNFAGESGPRLAPEHAEWLATFADTAAKEPKGLVSRYRLLGTLVGRLAQLKKSIGDDLSARSPMEKYDDVEKDLREKWEDELDAAVESEYRRQRAELLVGLQLWLRDVWLRSLGLAGETAALPQLAAATQTVAARLPAEHAAENLRTIETTQRILHTNVQEALALEVGLLKLRL